MLEEDGQTVHSGAHLWDWLARAPSEHSARNVWKSAEDNPLCARYIVESPWEFQNKRNNSSLRLTPVILTKLIQDRIQALAFFKKVSQVFKI